MLQMSLKAIDARLRTNQMLRRQFARLFDHTNLKPIAQRADIETLCREAAEFQFASVCIAPRWVKIAHDLLLELDAKMVNVCTVIGFPHGNSSTAAKVFESKDAVNEGASEIDMVISIGDLRDRNLSYVENDIFAVTEIAHASSVLVKVILETAYLEPEQIIMASRIAVEAGADFVKTSTGFASRGADAKIVQLIRQVVGSEVGVKAAGGIRTLEDAQLMFHSGATRLGCSSSVEIMKEALSAGDNVI